MKSHCTPSMLKSKLIKLFFFKELRLLYIGVTGFRTHTSPAIFVPVLCLLCLYYVSTMPVLCLLCLLCLYYVSTMPVLCLLCLYYVSTMPIYNHPFFAVIVVFYNVGKFGFVSSLYPVICYFQPFSMSGHSNQSPWQP